MIKPDFVKLDSSFEISDSRSGDIIKVTDEPRMTKTRKFDYLIVPKSPGDFVINPVFVFFNPVQNRYVLIQDSMKIHITGTNIALASQDQKDIADINRNVSLEYHSPTLFKDYRSWILICLPLGLLIFNFYQRNADYFKSKKSKNKPDQTSLSNELSVANLENHLLHKFFLMYPMISDDSTLVVVKQFLHQKKANDALAEKYLDLIQQLETIKYSGSATPDQLRQLKDKIQIL